MKKKLAKSLFLILLILYVNPENQVKASDSFAVLFYSNTCVSCHELNAYIQKLNKISSIEIMKFDITEKKNLELLEAYCEFYRVDEKEYAMVPIVFVGEQYIYGQEKIQNELTSDLIQKNGSKTAVIGDVKNMHSELENKKLNVISILCAGFVNGLNPCSVSMLLFFLTLTMMTKKKLLQFGLSFLVGKFVMFYLLGTVLYKILHIVNFQFIQSLTKYVFIIFGLVFMTFNIIDFLLVKKKKFDKVILQLPKSLVKFNHNMMRRVKNMRTGIFIIMGCVLLGALVVCGEFLCTGQIYLATIITLVQLNTDHMCLLYLLLYDIGFILPLGLCLLVVYKGTSIMELSNELMDKMPYIKLINAFVFLIFSIINLVGLKL